MSSVFGTQERREDDFGQGDLSTLFTGPRQTTGENSLALAILQQAIDDLRAHRRATDPHKRRMYSKAYRWVVSDDRSWLYSFVSICELLDVAPQTMRSKLLSLS